MVLSREIRFELILVIALAAAWTGWIVISPAGPLILAGPLIPIVIAGCAMGMIGLLQRRRGALIAFLCFVTVFPSISFRTREIGAPGLDWQNGLKLVIWLLLVGYGLATLRTWIGLLRDRILLGFLCFGAFAIASSIYSPVPAYSAACAIGMVGYMMFANVVASNVDERDVLLSVCFGLGAYLAAGWLFAAMFPGSAFLPPNEGQDGYRMLGLSSHPNMLAIEATCFIAALVTAFVKGYVTRRTTWLLALLGVATIIASGSRTSALALALSISAVEARRRGLLPLFVVIAVGCASMAAYVYGVGLLGGIEDVLRSLSRSGDAREILTLTGRTDLWAFVWEKIMERPLFGHGFNSAEAVLSRDWYGNADAGYNAHNVLLQALLTVGFLGTAPFVFAMVLLVARWLTQRQRTLASYVIPYILILGFTEVHITAIPTLLTLMVFVSIALDARKDLPAYGDAKPFNQPGGR